MSRRVAAHRLKPLEIKGLAQEPATISEQPGAFAGSLAWNRSVAAAHPERFYQCFIAEQAMVGAAMNLAARRVRFVTPQSPEDDPLRTLRALRVNLRTDPLVPGLTDSPAASSGADGMYSRANLRISVARMNPCWSTNSPDP